MADSIILFGIATDGPIDRRDTVNGVSISLSEPDVQASVDGEEVSRFDSRISVLGGHITHFGDSYPRDMFLTTTNVTDTGNTARGIGGRLEFRTNSDQFSMRVYCTGYSSEISLIIDGRYVSAIYPEMPSDGSLRWLTFDLSGSDTAGTWKIVQIEFQGGVNFGGLRLAAGTEIEGAEHKGPRLVLIGDSVSESGAAPTPGEDWISILARSLGISDVWESALGGTGYERPLYGRLGLVDRIQQDGVAANGDLYVIAMGQNDHSDMRDGAAATYAALIDGNPRSRIIVLTTWNPTAPNGASRTDIDAEIKEAASKFPSIDIIDISDVGYTTIDGIHANADGHWTISQRLYNKIRSLLGIDGAICQYFPGDIVGPLFLDNFDPAQDYSFEVLAGGMPTSQFEVVATGDAFPLLKLADGVGYSAAGPLTLEVRATGSQGALHQGSVSFEVDAVAKATMFMQSG